MLPDMKHLIVAHMNVQL